MKLERSLKETLQAALSEPSFQAFLSEHQRQRARLSEKLGLPASPRNLRSRRWTTKRDASEPEESSSLGVANCNSVLYTTNIQLGGQPFPVIIDSGSSDIWVESKSCAGCSGSESGYDPQKSNTYAAVGADSDFELTYLDQTNVIGKHGYETLQLGDVMVPNQVFAEVTSMYNSTEKCDEMGILGLGFSDVSSHNFPALLSNLKTILPNPVFSLYLDEHNDYELRLDATTQIESPIPKRAPESKSSELTFGGVNASHYSGCLQWHDLGQFRAKGETFKGYWDFGLEKVMVGQEEFPASKLALIDSGSTFSAGSSEAVGHIAKKLSMDCFVLTESYPGIEAVQCDDPFGFDVATSSCNKRLDPIVFQADGAPYELGTAELLVEMDTALGPLCVLGLLGFPGFPGWLLGMNFMRKYYTAFDFGNKKIGFAEARKHDDGSICEADAHLTINDNESHEIVNPTTPPSLDSFPETDPATSAQALESPFTTASPAPASTSAEQKFGIFAAMLICSVLAVLAVAVKKKTGRSYRSAPTQDLQKVGSEDTEDSESTDVSI